MSVLGHVAIGIVVARAITPAAETPDRLAPRMVGLAALALLPDSDFVLGALARGSPLFIHRGPTHSLLAAVLVGLVVAFVLVVARDPAALRWGLIAGLVVASHGFMDAIGDSSVGVELLWPFSDVRLLAPWQLLPDPSLTPPLVRNFLGALLAEAVVFSPAWLYAFLPRSLLARNRGPGSTSR
jgi:inner membrane protein